MVGNNCNNGLNYLNTNSINMCSLIFCFDNTISEQIKVNNCNSKDISYSVLIRGASVRDFSTSRAITVSSIKYDKNFF